MLANVLQVFVQTSVLLILIIGIFAFFVSPHVMSHLMAIIASVQLYSGRYLQLLLTPFLLLESPHQYP